ncbi:MAG: TerB family tellurite resistance protein [Bacteroidia bacterium]|nr:TerB family tellurite resistance protein [Bacteroidia bacterium]MDW8236548.1 TerB family tellurite resistance protein [Bacteroidia bacterium]
MLTSRRFWDGIGGLAYAFAKADGAITDDEMQTFANRVEEAFRHFPTNFPHRSHSIIRMFHDLEYSAAEAYDEAIQHLRAVKNEVRQYRFDILNVFREVIRADGRVHPYESEFLDRLDKDLAQIAE